MSSIPALLEKVIRFNLFKWKEGKLEVFNLPCIVYAIFVFVYVQKILEEHYSKKDAMDIMFNWGRFQAKHGFRIISKRFGYSKLFKDKYKLLHFNTQNGELIGIGSFKWVRADFKNKLFIMKGKSTIAEEYVKLCGLQKHAIDHYIRGQATAFIEELLNEECFCVESKCISQGNPYCEFIVKPKSDFDSNDELFKSQEVKKFKSLKELCGKTNPLLF